MKFDSSGQVAKLLLVLAVVVFVAIIITFLIIKMAEKPKEPETTEENPVVLPVYEQKLGNIRFVFKSARDLGNTLKASNRVNTTYSTQNDLTTTEKFIEVTIGAQNKGTKNTEANAWDIGNIIDSDGRNFVPIESYLVNAWLPTKNPCGALLKPEFDPTPCTNIYEVSNGSTGLKVEVQTGTNENSASDFSGGRRETFLLDLIIK
jgi:uncharacterized protein (UPF0333 family)